MQLNDKVQHVYLVGAKSLGAYGGYETFVYKLTEYHQNKENIKYHVACKANGDGCMDESKFEGVTKINDHEFELHNAHCFKIDVPQIGPAQAIYYDVAALKTCCEHIKKNHIPHPIVYIMACRIGPFAAHFYKEIHKLGGTVFLNPDGHEWMRARWAAPIRKYILADIFQCGDVRLQGFQLGAQLCAAGLQRRKFGIQCRKIHRCAAVQLHQGADSFIKGVQLLFVLGGVSVLGQLEVLLDKGIMDGLQLGMDSGSVFDLGDCPHTVFVLLQLPAERSSGLV